jgi:hypothetical protein
MRFKKTIELIRYLDYLIRNRATGSPSTLAKKLGVSIRSVFYYIKELKELGAPIKWNPCEETYIYDENMKFRLVIDFEIIHFQSKNAPQNIFRNDPGRRENYINH